MRTKSFVWVAIIVFGSGLGALMVASILLHRAAGPAVSREDLKAPVTGLRLALTEWKDYETVTRYTSDISKQAYQQHFDHAHGGDPVRTRGYKGMLSAMDTFPSLRFPGMSPLRVDVEYEVKDGSSAARPSTSFASTDKGYFLRTARFPVASTAKPPGGRIVFHEGDNIALDDVLERLFSTLMGGSLDDFRALMALEPPDMAKTKVMKQLDRIRAQVMTCRTERLKKMLPQLGPLPRGAKWFRLLVLGEIGETNKKTLWINITVVPGDPVRIRHFGAGILKKPPKSEKPGAK